MNERIVLLLTEIYGVAGSASLRESLTELLTAFPRPPHGARTTELTEREVLLITYADQVREPDRKPLATLADFTRCHLTDVVSGVHLLPFYPWSSDDGFSVKDFFAVAPEYGTWEDLQSFQPEFALMFDAVFNHLSVQGDWFERFRADVPEYRDFFIAVSGDPDLSKVIRPRVSPLLTEFRTARGVERIWTTFSADQADLNFRNPQVLLAVLRALLFYARHGAKFIRLDAIAFLWKEIGTTCLHLLQTHQLIQLMRAVLDAVAPEVRLITETNVPHADNISYFGDGTNEAQLVYNFALPPLVLHTLATGNAEKLSAWAAALKTPSSQTTFFNFLASHDGIGLNPARDILSSTELDALVARAKAHGGYVSSKKNPDGSESPYELNINFFDALSHPDAAEPLEVQVKRFLVAHAVMFALAGVPGIYFHSLFGSRNDQAGAKSSGIPRRINRQKLSRAKLEAELQQPTALQSRVFSGMRELLRQRRSHSAFAPAARQGVLNLDPRVFAVKRKSPDGVDAVLCLHNVSAESVTLSRVPGLVSTCHLQPYEVLWMALDD